MGYFNKAMLVASAALCFNLSTFAQDISLKINNVTVKEAMEQLKKTSGYSFVFSSNDINTKQRVSVSAEDATIEEVVKQILKGQKGIDYEIQGKKIVLKKKNLQYNVSHKTVKVKGNVLDANGDPIIGATIKEKGTSNGTITDFDGNFSFDVSDNSILEISYIGYKPQELKAISGKELAVVLKEDTEMLDEVVVVGFGVQKKVNLSGSVSTVSTKQIEDRPVVNVGQALQGTVANLNITIGSGQATDSPSFNIRGITSLNDSSPLVVIDGVISDTQTLNTINANDIASISVLKDAASCAIYGSRAAYGVILVTTKIGKSEKVTINYNNNFSFRQNTQKQEVITDPYIVAQVKNIMGRPFYNLYNEEQLAYAKKVSEDPTVSPYLLNPDGTYSYFGSTDWVDEAYRKTGFATTHSVDISGKSEKLNYFVSAGYNFTDGMIRYGTDKYNRYNLRSKLDFKITDYWTISNNTQAIITDYDAPTSLGSSYYWGINRINPMYVPKNPDGTWTDNGAEWFGCLQDGGRSIEKSSYLSTQFGTRLDLIKDVFFINGNFSYNTKKNTERWSYLPVEYYIGPESSPYYYNEVSSASSTSSSSENITFDIYGTFTKIFNDVHSFTAIAGFNQEEYRYEYMKLGRNQLISSSLPTPNLATGDMNVSETIYSLALRGAYARLNYTYNDKYIFEFNGRYDGTSRFPKDSRFVFSPSGSLAWVISKEKFFKPLNDVVSFLKLRYSYGLLGNQNNSSYYPYIASMSSGKSSYIIDGARPVYVNAPGLVSGNLTWEKVSTSNIGIDINFFNNRLSLSGDYYIRRTMDMVTSGQPLPGVLGADVPSENAADLKTKGWEITANWKDNFEVNGKPLNYQIGFNLADSRSFITKFYNPTGTLSSYYEGYEFGQMWGYTTEGFFTSDEDVKNHADQTKVASYLTSRPLEAGDLKFADINGDGEISAGANTLKDHGDKKIIGNSSKRYTFGINAYADWNGFDLSVFFQGVGKRDYYPGSGDLYFWGIYSQPWTNITYGNYYDRWTEDNPNGYFPRMKGYVAEYTEAALTQTKYMQNAAYIRLKNLTLGYTLPETLVNKLGLSRVRMYFSGDNIFTISGLYKHYNIDPEGLGGQMYPLQRSYSIGLNITF